MSWLRLDDGFVDHPKVIALGTPPTRWAWLEVLMYCARHRTSGRIPEGIGDVVRRATPALLSRARDVGLIDVDEQGAMRVHDWNTYNVDPTNAERQARYRSRKRNAESDADVTGRAVTDNSLRAQPRARGPSRPQVQEQDRDEVSRDCSDLERDQALPPRDPHAAATPPLEGSSSAAATNGRHHPDDDTIDPEGIARIAEIMADASARAAEQHAGEDLDNADRRRAAAAAKLAKIRDENTGA